MTPLKERLINRISLAGPITVAEYMTECLLHPEHGYYASGIPFGRGGDFVTAPEISQMFGECLGLALAQAWLDQGAPAPFLLVEVGPGLGTMIADVVRATRHVPGFRDGLHLHLVEASTKLREAQQTRLAGTHATWHSDLGALPDLPLFLLANEFFDALPIRQFLRDGPGWRERVIGTVDGRLAFGLTDPAPIAALTERLTDTKDGEMVEFSAASHTLATEIGRRLTSFGGAAYLIDYGGWGKTGDTFQAVSRHKKVDPLADPGAADLTAHVDFRGLAVSATPAAHSSLTPQGVFLERIGITERANALAERLSGKDLDSHIAAHRRLTHPDEMGSLFQVLALYPALAPVPPGVDP